MLNSILLVLNIFFLEALLSVDNAAVLAVMVKDLPARDQPRALRYGMAGAFIFRGLSLFIVSWLVKVIWIKAVGGLYLLYLVYGHFSPKKDTIEEGVDKNTNKIYLLFKRWVGAFWSTVILVEIMDMAFSIDNIFAAVAMTSNFTLIIIGVILGIIAMRIIATWFTRLMQKYPFLEKSAFIVIALLGLKLIFMSAVDYIAALADLKKITGSHYFDFIFSGVMLLIFFIPILTSRKKKLYATE